MIVLVTLVMVVIVVLDRLLVVAPRIVIVAWNGLIRVEFAEDEYTIKV